MQALPVEQFVERLGLHMPPLTTTYDVLGRKDCLGNCSSKGGEDWLCQQRCRWYCQGNYTNITEPTYGLCDERRGCDRLCGVPDEPLVAGGASAPWINSRYSVLQLLLLMLARCRMMTAMH
jgi:hypothetical protein